MRESNYVLFVGPYPPPMHGQSFAFKMAYDNFLGPKLLISQNLEEVNCLRKLYKAIICLCKYLFVFCVYKIQVVYVAGSRSVLGSFKDVILIQLAKLFGIKVINHIHASHFDIFLDELPIFLKNIYIKSYSKVDVFIALLPQMVAEYTRFANSKIEVVENFYDPILDDSIANPIQSVGSDGITISYYSNIIYSKGILDVLDSFLILSEKYSDIKLQIAGNYGSDSYFSSIEIRNKFEQYLNNPRIKFAGQIIGISKKEFLENSQISILPSFYASEAFPISILEAMRCGNAIIVSNHHYLPKIINSNSGIVVEPKNINSICQAIEYLINNLDELQKMRNFNLNTAKKNYSIENYCKKLYDILLS